jgi:hypothetical protein
MQNRLQKLYVVLLAPALVGFMAAAFQRGVHPSTLFPARTIALAAPLLLVLAAVFALAAPIFCRSLFAYRRRHLSEVSPAALFKLECLLMTTALLTPYVALAGYCLQLPRFHLGVTLLTALYAVYYYYPSHRRIRLDMTIFRVADQQAAGKAS